MQFSSLPNVFHSECVFVLPPFLAAWVLCVHSDAPGEERQQSAILQDTPKMSNRLAHPGAMLTGRFHPAFLARRVTRVANSCVNFEPVRDAAKDFFSTVFDSAEMQVLLMIASILSLAVGDFFGRLMDFITGCLII